MRDRAGQLVDADPFNLRESRCAFSGLHVAVAAVREWHARCKRVGMLKRKTPPLAVAKVTRGNGIVVVDVESGLLLGVSVDIERERASSLTERRSQPPGDPSSERSRN